MSSAWTCPDGHRWHPPDGAATATCPQCGAAGAPTAGDETLPPTATSDSHPDIRVPGFDLLTELGRGSMGVVYRARDVKLGRPVALKMILAGAHASPTDRARF